MYFELFIVINMKRAVTHSYLFFKNARKVRRVDIFSTAVTQFTRNNPQVFRKTRRKKVENRNKKVQKQNNSILRGFARNNQF